MKALMQVKVYFPTFFFFLLIFDGKRNKNAKILHGQVNGLRTRYLLVEIHKAQDKKSDSDIW